MLVLGIESSCDDTSIAIVKNTHDVLAMESISQVDKHRQWQGVIPEIAAREHLKGIGYLYQRVMEKAGCKIEDIDLIATTAGPGLIGSLLVGASFSKGLAYQSGKPCWPVNHVHAHLSAVMLKSKEQVFISPQFPALGVVVSGGHTNLYLMKDPLDYQVIGLTLDDACGECLDKIAKLCGLDYPGGPEIERLAKKGDPERFKMPKMMADQKGFDVSYSGLKTHVFQMVTKDPSLKDNCDFIASVQHEAYMQIVRKIKAALEKWPDIESVLVAGGVSVNGYLRELLQKHIDRVVFFAPKAYCQDNAAMVTVLPSLMVLNTVSESRSKSLLARYQDDLSWEPYSRYPFTDFFHPDYKKI